MWKVLKIAQGQRSFKCKDLCLGTPPDASKPSLVSHWILVVGLAAPRTPVTGHSIEPFGPAVQVSGSWALFGKHHHLTPHQTDKILVCIKSAPRKQAQDEPPTEELNSIGSRLHFKSSSISLQDSQPSFSKFSNWFDQGLGIFPELPKPQWQKCSYFLSQDLEKWSLLLLITYCVPFSYWESSVFEPLLWFRGMPCWILWNWFSLQEPKALRGPDMDFPNVHIFQVLISYIVNKLFIFALHIKLKSKKPN